MNMLNAMVLLLANLEQLESDSGVVAQDSPCTPWKIAFLLSIVVAVVLGAILIRIWLKRRWIRIQWMGTIVLVCLAAPSIVVLCEVIGLEVKVNVLTWPAALLGAVGLAAFTCLELQHKQIEERREQQQNAREAIGHLDYQIQAVFRNHIVGWVDGHGIEHRVTQEEVAQELGVTVAHVSTIILYITIVSRLLKDAQDRKRINPATPSEDP